MTGEMATDAVADGEHRWFTEEMDKMPRPVTDDTPRCNHWPGQPRCEVCGMGMTDDTPRDPLAAIREALTDEDEIAHGEAWNENHGSGYGLGECAYCDEPWPCRTQRGIDRLLTTLDATRPSGDEALRAAVGDVIGRMDGLSYRGQHFVNEGVVASWRDTLRAALATPSSTPDVENKP